MAGLICDPRARLAHKTLWERRFHAITNASLQAQIVHRDFVPLWLNAQFADLFAFASTGDALKNAKLTLLFEHQAHADSEAASHGAERAHFGRRMLRRHDGAPFAADLYTRRIAWDDRDAIAVAIVDVGEEECALAELGALLHPPPAPPINLPAAPVRARDVLLSSRSESWIAAMEASLRALGHHPFCTISGALAAAQRPDIAIVDLADPHALDAVRRMRVWWNGPIIAVSTRPGLCRHDTLAELGVDAVLDWPTTQTRLAHTIALLANAGPSLD